MPKQSEPNPREEVLLDAEAGWDSMSYDQREAATIIVFNAIREAIREPRTFRGLIYDLLGFDLTSYTPLYLAGGMDITNYICEHTEDETQ